VTKSEFLELARKEGIRADSFSFEDGDECYVLADRGWGWNVFYRERGLERGLGTFASESDALQHLLKLLRDDPTSLSL
jgi:hypothetical protein